MWLGDTQAWLDLAVLSEILPYIFMSMKACDVWHQRSREFWTSLAQKYSAKCGVLKARPAHTFTARICCVPRQPGAFRPWRVKWEKPKYHLGYSVIWHIYLHTGPALSQWFNLLTGLNLTVSLLRVQGCLMLFSKACTVASTLPSCAFLYLWGLKNWRSLRSPSRESGIIGPDLKTKLNGLPVQHPLQPLRTLCLLHLNYIFRQVGE